jgi:ATP-binding cassette, subfamily B, bacterial
MCKKQLPKNTSEKPPAGPSVFRVLKPYRKMIALLTVLSVSANGLTLWLPKITSQAIDSFAKHTFVVSDVVWSFGGVSLTIFVLTYLLSIVQTFASERVAKDMRNELASKISKQSYAYVQTHDPNRLLTNLTSDMDAIKLFVAQAIVSLISSVVLITGGAALLINIDWRLGIAVLSILPPISFTFFFTLRRVRQLFIKSRAVIDRLNSVINESILGAALVRVIHSRYYEAEKFEVANAGSRDIGYSIVKIFSGLIPLITFVANCATLIILLLGGHYVINRTLSLGNFAAFSSYMVILIFPILVLGFISNIIAQANASYGRIAQVLDAPDVVEAGTLSEPLRGDIEASHIGLSFSGKKVLDDISFKIKAGSRTAIIGPTAAGKSQLLYVLTGLVTPETGNVEIDGHPLKDYDKKSLHSQLGIVFQDSIVFNLSLRENIAFSPTAQDDDLKKAISTAELDDLVKHLPKGLETIISERGTSLSGGQKQRLMLSRALALNPKILLLDDFTARVDSVTEAKILANIQKNYPGITFVSVTQKIGAVEDYDQIILLMEGELLASGTHKKLLTSSPEYMQIFNSQRSTEAYEVHPQ